MFHVERTLRDHSYSGLVSILLLFFITISCNAIKNNIQIQDYILVPNGKEIIGNENLTAFIFENNRRNLSIEQFLSVKYKIENYSESEFWITIDKSKYKIIVYDYAEFEKYFNSSNYAVINLDPSNVRTEDKREFIAISMINSYNEDCLSDGSLFQNLAINYLKNLKHEYYNQ